MKQRFYRPRFNPLQVIAFIDSAMTAAAVTAFALAMAVCVAHVTAWLLGIL